MKNILWYGDVYEYALTEISIEGLDAKIRHSMCEKWENKKIANLHALAIHKTSRLWLHEHNVRSNWTSPTRLKPQTQRQNQWSSQISSVNAMRSWSSLSSSAYTRNTSDMPVLAMRHTASQSFPASSDTLSLQIASLGALSIMDSAAFCRVCFSKNHKMPQWTFILEERKYAFTSFRNANLKKLLTCLTSRSDWSDQTASRSGIRHYRGKSF